MSLKDTLWQRKALCQHYDPKYWFPPKQSHSPVAFNVCNKCSVKETCLRYALKFDEDEGIWGGLTSADRAYMQRLTGKGIPFNEAYLRTVKKRTCLKVKARDRRLPPTQRPISLIKSECGCDDPYKYRSRQQDGLGDIRDWEPDTETDGSTD